MTINIAPGADYPGNMLDVYTAYLFTFREGFLVNSLAGFLESLKYRNNDDQKKMMQVVDAGKIKGIKRIPEIVFWKGESIERNSQEYQQLLDEVFKSLFTQSAAAKQALIDTKDEALSCRYENDKSKTLLTRDEFITRLLNLREQLNSKQESPQQDKRKKKRGRSQ